MLIFVIVLIKSIRLTARLRVGLLSAAKPASSKTPQLATRSTPQVTWIGLE